LSQTLKIEGVINIVELLVLKFPVLFKKILKKLMTMTISVSFSCDFMH